MKPQIGQPCLFVEEHIEEHMWFSQFIPKGDYSGCIRFNAVSLKCSSEDVVELSDIIHAKYTE